MRYRWRSAGVQALFILVFLRHPVWRPPASASVIILYLIALGWVYVSTRGSNDWVVHVGQGCSCSGRSGCSPCTT